MKSIPSFLVAAALTVGYAAPVLAGEGESSRASGIVATARRMAEALQTDAEYQRQKAQFEAAERQLAADPAFQAQRERMLMDLPMLERSVDLTAMKLQMDADLLLLKSSPEIGQQQKRLQEDTSRPIAAGPSTAKAK
jgi:hypothetical protein